MKITVQSIFDKVLAKHGEVVAGKNGMDREVKRITVAELPDILDWLMGGELVCTTGYFLVDDVELQTKWIARMNEKGIAALILKPDRFLGSIPEEMIRLADACDFPIISMPKETKWPTVIANVMDIIISMQNEQLSILFKSHNALTQMLFSLKPPEIIVREIASQSQAPVVLMDRSMELISSVYDGEENGDLWARFSSEWLARLKGEIRNCTAENEVHFFPTDNREWSVEGVYITPIIADIHHFGWLLVMATEDSDERFLSEFVRSSAIILSLSFLNRYTPFILETTEKARYIGMLSGEINVPEKEFAEASNILGLTANRKTQIVVVKLNEEISQFAFKQIQSIARSYDNQVTVLLSQNQLVFFLHPPAHIGDDNTLAQSVQMVEQIALYWKDVSGGWFVGFSHVFRCTESNLKEAYNEAVICLKKAERTGQNMVSYKNLGLDKLYALIPDQRKLMHLSASLLQPLQQYDKKNHTQMQETLYAYLRNNRNKTLTSQELYIHQNTLSYRLDRIKTLLKADLDDVETSILYYIASEIACWEQQMDQKGSQSPGSTAE